VAHSGRAEKSTPREPSSDAESRDVDQALERRLKVAKARVEGGSTVKATGLSKEEIARRFFR
jgi:hypothetical protein